jgi:exodeoxyribonuclease VII large subunit
MRQRRAVVRPLQLGRERLEARARRLPLPQTLLAQASQHLDEQAVLLRRALLDRAAEGRQRLSGAGAGLSAPLLRLKLQQAQERLLAARLTPALVAARIEAAHQRLTALWRMAAALDPRAVLGRGYAIIRGDSGTPVLSAAAARAQAALEIEFADGRLAVASGPARPRSAAPRPPAGAQGKLL